MKTTMEKLDLFKGMTLSDEEIFVIHGGISITEEGGSFCGGSCNGGDGGACGLGCRWKVVWRKRAFGNIYIINAFIGS